MKTFERIVCISIAALHCSFATIAVPVEPLRQSGGQPPAITFTSNEFIDVTEYVDITCAAESVILQGQLHVLTHFTVTGNNVVSKTHFQSQGITGTGTESGNKYRSVGVTQEISKGSFSNGQYTATMIDNFRVIGQGPGNNLLIHATFHITLNANGTTTTLLDAISVDCK